MSLVEDCTLRLDDPVTKFLPELAERRVLTRLDAALDDTVPAKRDITLRDLLTFRMGTGMAFGGPSGTPLQRRVQELGIDTFGPPKRLELSNDEWIKRFATLPLQNQPGEAWRYNTGFAVLGVLLARAAGRPLDVILKERLLDPLGMKHTAFHRPGETAPGFLDATSGLFSTADDLLAFGQMMLAKGRGVLSRRSVELMTTNQVTDEQLRTSGFPLQGWGFGVEVCQKRTSLYTTPGRYGWDGGTGTSWANDPAEDLIGVLLTERGGFPPAQGFYQDFWTAAYAAL
jgi:CubicO group peptidase (beta-lactamase class C family)